MKKTTLLTSVLLLFAFMVNAQEDTSNSSYTEYNKWSVDLGVGIGTSSSPFSSGYNSGEFGDMAYNLSGRYMLNDKVGVRAGVMFTTINEGDNSLPFSTDVFTLTGEGVLNLGSILNISDFTDTFNLLAHGGVQRSTFSFDNGAGNDNTLGFIVGLTPQVKLSDNVALNIDGSFMGNIMQNTAIDGNARPMPSGFDGWMANITAGVSIYLGDNDQHADWVGNTTENMVEEKMGGFDNKLAMIESGMQDTDKDGVPNYLDTESNTTAGVAVNSKGEAIDTNKNGVPDELESSLTEMFVTKEYIAETTSGSGVEAVKPDANDDLVNVYFKFDSTQPEYYSLDAISKIVKYMRVYPEANAVLTGYSDQIGNKAYNNKLSEARAKRVYDIVVAAGIDASRLSYKGGGVDTSVNKDSEAARQMVRRVSFQLK